jgi:hypothetical protein
MIKKIKDVLIDVFVFCFVDAGVIVLSVGSKLGLKLCGECLFCRGPKQWS